MPNTEEKKIQLAQYRQEIDMIDQEILDMLGKRIQIVKNVGELKNLANSKQTIIRPGREAIMVRKMALDRDIGFPPAALAQIWRMIIAGAINVEEHTQISVLDKNSRECFWLSREYFGSFTPITSCETSSGAIYDVHQGESTVAVVPLWDNSQGVPWWVSHGDDYTDLKIFARLPFLRLADSRLAPVVALANLQPETSSEIHENNDGSYWVFKTKRAQNADSIEPFLLKSGLQCYLQAVNNGEEFKHYLFEIDGFINDTNADIKTAIKQMSNTIISADYLGSYAKPILL